ncbi:MAG: arsenate reductase ArsC [Acidobacteriota bacterium]
MRVRRILFVCTGNSARSQMAEGFARYYGGRSVRVDSAGTRPASLHPVAIWAMNEVGIDISHQTSDPLDGKNMDEFDYAVTLCGDARDSCPRLPDPIQARHWDLADPAAVRGRPSDVKTAFEVIRNQIERKVKDLLREIFA